MCGEKNIFMAGAICCAVVLTLGVGVFGENIDPDNTGNQYGWGENVGWLNFEPTMGPGVQVSGDKVVGFVWAENIGWISLSCESTSSCGTVDFGVVNDGAGNLSGFAWSENTGWINFDPVVSGDPTDYGVKIGADGKFEGWAWGENIGWIRFDSAASWDVQGCVVSLEDLRNFAALWLSSGRISGAANLDGAGGVDNADFSMFADYWQRFCPDGWQLK